MLTLTLIGIAAYWIGTFIVLPLGYIRDESVPTWHTGHPYYFGADSYLLNKDRRLFTWAFWTGVFIVALIAAVVLFAMVKSIL